MFNEINTRIALKRDTEANWTSNNPIPLNGEVILVDVEDKVRFKVGDGEKTYNQLPFSDLILGEEEETAFPGNLGKKAYDFSEKIFIAEYKKTTYQECYDAIVSGKLVFLNYYGAFLNFFMGQQDLLVFSITNCAKYTDGFFHVGECIFLSKDNIWERVGGPYFIPDEGRATGILKRTNIYEQLEQAIDGEDYISPVSFPELFGVYIAEYGQVDENLINLIGRGVTCFVKRRGYLYPLYTSADIDNGVRFCGFAGIQDAPHNDSLVVEFVKYFEDGRGDNGWEVFKTYNTVQLGETSSTAYPGDKGKAAYNHATAKGSAFSSGLYKITTNSEGHVTAAAAVTKTDITSLDIPAQDTWKPNSTTSEGYVASSDGQTGVFWRTDSNGNPSWGQIVRGTDYWTEEDKNEIKQYVEDAILGGAW